MTSERVSLFLQSLVSCFFFSCINIQNGDLFAGAYFCFSQNIGVDSAPFDVLITNEDSQLGGACEHPGAIFYRELCLLVMAK